MSPSPLLPSLTGAAALTLSLVGAVSAKDAQSVLAAARAATAPFPDSGAVEIEWRYSGQGLKGTAKTKFDSRTGDFADAQQLGIVSQASGFDGRIAWQEDPSGAVVPEAGGDVRQLAVNEAYRDAQAWRRPNAGGARISLLGEQEASGRSCDVVEITPRGGKPFQAWFDQKTHLLARTIEVQGFQTVVTSFSDYGEAGGMRLPRTTVIDDGDGPSQLQTLTLLAVRRLPPPPSTAFSEPKGDLRNWRFAGGGERTTVPFQLLNNHIYAEVKVDGKGPFLFIFDTGGQEILMPATAKALAQGISGDAAGRGAGEGTVSVGFTRVRSIRIGDLELGPETVVVEPFETRAVDGVDEGGMIGFGTFRRLVTRIDYGRHTLTFIEPAHFDPRGAGTPIPFAFYNTIPQVEGAFESLEGKFDIDTGSRTSIDITTPFVRAHDLIARHPKGVLVVDGWGVGGPSRDFVTRGGRLRLGSVTVPSVVAGLSTQRAGAFTDPNYEGNVGAGILKRFVVTFDYGHRIMYLKPIAGPLVDVGTFDRSGMWINEVGDGVEVMSLSVAGPADRAGLKVGDHIVAIDGERTTQVSLSDLRRKLRDDPAGTIEHLEVKSGGEERKVALTLRDQI